MCRVKFIKKILINVSFPAFGGEGYAYIRYTQSSET